MIEPRDSGDCVVWPGDDLISQAAGQPAPATRCARPGAGGVNRHRPTPSDPASAELSHGFLKDIGQFGYDFLISLLCALTCQWPSSADTMRPPHIGSGPMATYLASA